MIATTSGRIINDDVAQTQTQLAELLKLLLGPWRQFCRNRPLCRLLFLRFDSVSVLAGHDKKGSGEICTACGIVHVPSRSDDVARRLSISSLVLEACDCSFSGTF